MKKILVINGPNLNLLGKREPQLYGTLTLEDINHTLKQKAGSLGVFLDFFQSNHEGEIIDCLQKIDDNYDGAILNAGALTHTSLAIRDTVLALTKPVIEVHITNPYARESSRKHSFLAGAAHGVIGGFGPRSYELALYWFATS
ncbi:MAG: type II 3-dehydroquinate dehydratase [Deltaproteobacteria bacterium]|jgi:3-dehydroquinate dehydratase-2|nr:type II 3-dehydroquinate dehydratase [Deltaproteobacteria bacterium]